MGDDANVYVCIESVYSLNVYIFDGVYILFSIQYISCGAMARLPYRIHTAQVWLQIILPLLGHAARSME